MMEKAKLKKLDLLALDITDADAVASAYARELGVGVDGDGVADASDICPLAADPELASAPVVVLTTSNDDQDKIDAYNLNVAGYLLKPVTFSNFCERMTTLNKYWTLVEMP